MNVTQLEDRIASVLSRYDAENDVIPGTPSVTHSDAVALEAIANLIMIIKDQQKSIESLELVAKELHRRIELLRNSNITIEIHKNVIGVTKDGQFGG